MVTSPSGCTATTASAASTCAVRRLSRTQKASETAMRRPGGHAPSIHPMSMTMLGSLTVTQRRQCGASAGTTRATWRAKTSGEPGLSQNSSPEPPRVGEVVQRDHGLEAPRRAQGEDLGVALERRRVEPARRGLQPGPFHREPERVAPDGGGAVQCVFGVAPEVARHTRARHPADALPAGPVVVGLAVPVEAAFDLVARRRHTDGEALAEQARRPGARRPRPRPRPCGRGPARRRGFRHTTSLTAAARRPRGARESLSAAAPRSASATGRPTRGRPRRGHGAPGSAPAARWHRCRPAARPPARPWPRR